MNRLTALVIGNGDYPKAGKLKNPTNDAQDLSDKLRAGSFEVTTVLNAKIAEMAKALKAFQTAATDGDVALFFFAGHGIQIDGENYLIAVDTDVADETDAKYSALPLNKVIEAMEKAETSTSIIILDACRNNPWERAWRGGLRGMAPVYAPRGTLIAFSTSPGQLAEDGKGQNGAYTAALLKHIDAPDVTIEAMFKRVRNTLGASTGQKQISWEHTSLSGEFYFNLSVAIRITDYSASAIKDRTFVLDEARYSHGVIKALKTLTWPRQNPAIDDFTAEKASRAGTDSLFVVGRNIYQAADGSSKSARRYINNFVARTAGMAPKKRKALLDGMLFEIFFNSDGEYREKPKTYCFNDVFALQAFPDLEPSFDFIAGCLAGHADQYFSLPGKSHAISVDVTLSDDPENAVTAVHIGGRSVLRLDDPDYDTPDKIYRTSPRSSFEETQSGDMLVPLHLVKFTYSRPVKGDDSIKFPYGYSVRRTI
jgi:hypothetical protein